VKLWDVASGRELFSLPHPREVMSATFSPDGSLIASAGWDNIGRIWKVSDGTLVREFRGHTDFLTSVAFSPDQKLLATSSLDNTAKIWEVTSGLARTLAPDPVAREAEADRRLLTIAFSSNGRQVATGSAAGTARLWDPVSGRLLASLAANSGWVKSVNFSPDGTRLATAGRDGTLRIWNSKSGDELLNLDPHGGPLASAAYHPSGGYVASAGDDGAVRVFILDIDELKVLARSRVTRPLTPEECQKYLHEKSCADSGAPR
jgi:WD40 repeat protein